jgi:hypothetical protein
MIAACRQQIMLSVLLLVTVLSKAFLPFVRGHFMALTFFSAWHSFKFLSGVKPFIEYYFV